MYERKGDKLLPFPRFIGRVGKAFLMAFCIVVVGLLPGVLGYHFIAGLKWLDAVLNSAMILTGMGPVDPMKDAASKVFASAYALFSGVIFLTSIGIVLAPVFHRVVHKFHLEESPSASRKTAK
jgi:flagellar biosynthesis protein FliR